MKKNTKKVAAAIGIALVAGTAVGGLGGMTLFPKTEIITSEPLVEIKEVIKEVPVTVTEEVTVEVPVEVEVEVDNGNLDTVMEFVEDEIDEDITTEYILFEVEAKMLGEEFIRHNLVELLDEEDFFDNREVLEDYRKSEVSVKKIRDAEVADRDFEDLDLELKYEVRVRAKEDGEDKEYFDFEFTIPFENGEMVEEDIEVDFIEE